MAEAIAEKYTEIKNKVTELLHKSDVGLGTVEIAYALGVTRATADKYLEMMRMEGAIGGTTIGKSKIWTPKLHTYLERETLRQLAQGTPIRDLIVVDDDGRLSIAHRRVNIGFHMGFTHLYRAMDARLGREGADEVLYRWGLADGREIGQEAIRIVGFKPDEIREYILKSYTRIGMFQPLGTDFDLKRREARFRARNSYEVEMWKTSAQPVCHHVRGLCAGFASGILNRETRAAETQCQATGAPHCEFHVTWEPRPRTT
ncbi:MAG: hypothetical protein HY558_07130 [Euryarchaeota archaeon]|nr:hypothetical protein [Euryarchaeota archaeon]